jgi:transcriptional regulator with PAS, ATPase and Fis domain
MKKAKKNSVSKTDNYSSEIKQFARRQIENIMGKGKVICKIFHFAEDYAEQDTPLLIEGETGVGKKEIATYLHSISPRRNKEFVTIDCGAISETLIEAELFGSKKGAYTDAKEDRKGKVEIANGSTLFLDEINSLPIHLQIKLLHLIQEKEITRVGDTKPIKVDVRIIAAGNENFVDLVQKKHFRLDLYERFVETIKVPSLKERKEDMDFFIDKFIEEISDKLGKKGVLINKEARSLLKNHHWEGNVRQLMNFIHRLITHVKKKDKAKNYIINPELLTKCRLNETLTKKEETTVKNDFTMETALNSARKQAIEQALKEANGNNEKAIDLLKIPRSSYYEWKKKLGIN